MDTETAYERLVSLRYLKSLVAPKDFDSVTPALDVQTDIQTEVILLGNVTVQPAVSSDPNDVASSTFRAGSQTGLLTWHVLRGVACVNLHYLVPQLTTSNPANTQLKVSSVVYGQVSGTVFNLDYWLTFTQELFVSAAPLSQPRIAPDLASKFSLARFTNGYINIVSNTRSGTTVDLAGLIHAGSWSDTRDGWQDETNGAVTPTSLAQNSVTKKDGIVGEDIADGVYLIGGSDVGPAYIPINPNLMYHAGQVLLTSNPTMDDPGTATLILGSTDELTAIPSMLQYGFTNAYVSIGNGWISPWGITLNNSNVINGNITGFGTGELGIYPHQSVQIPNTAVYTRVTFAIGLYAAWNLGAYDTDPDQNPMQGTSLVLVSIDHFGQIAPSGALVVKQIISEANISEIGHQDLQTTGVHFTRHTVLVRPQPGTTYLGTYFTLRIQNNRPTANPMLAADTPFLPALGTRQCKVFAAIFAENENFGGTGELGPVRLARWQDVSIGQVITIKGLMRYGCITSGSLAPFVKPSANIDPMVGDINWLPISSMLFNSDAPDFKRCYSGKEYLHLVDELLPQLTIQSLRGDDRIPRPVTTMMESAGFFDTLGKGLLGAGLGALNGAISNIQYGPAGMMRGAAMGGIGGGIGGLTSAGTYAPMNSTGMYAPMNSAGMYAPMNSGAMYNPTQPIQAQQPSYLAPPIQQQNPIAYGPASMSSQINAAQDLLTSAGLYRGPSSTGRYGKRHRYQ